MPKQRNQVSAQAQAGSGNAICLSQSGTAGTALNLNGALVNTAYPIPAHGPVGAPGGPLSSGQILVPSSGQPIAGSAAVLSTAAIGAQNVYITSQGNDSGVNFTIKGLDAGGSPISEVIAGSSGAPGSVTSAYLYSVVYSITPNANTASTVTVGTQATIYSPWLILGSQRQHYEWNARTFIASGATATYDVQVTSDINLMNQTGGFADDIATVLAAQTGNTSSANNVPWEGIRLKVTAGGPVTLRVLETRTA